MQIDPELAVFLEQPFPNNFDDLAWSRREQRRLASENPVLPSSTVTWVDTSIGRSASGEDLRARVYRHCDADESSAALLFFHGGAFVFGDLDSEHARCVRYCDDCARVVVSVDYALAPEHPFPAAFDDAVTSFDWMVENSADLGIDPALIAVGGVSAGGAVASGLVLHLRDRGAATPRAQLLVYPVIDSRTDTPSMHQFFRAEPFDGERAQRMWSLYVPDGDVSPYASVARATDLSDLPPTYIVTADLDPLRDEALAYALALIDARNTVELHHYPRTYHGFDAVAPAAQVSQRALREQCAFLERELRP